MRNRSPAQAILQHTVGVARRLSPELSWPLKASDIEDALGARTPDVRLVRVTWERTPATVPLWAVWCSTRPELTGMTHRDSHEVWISPVARERHSVVSELLRRAALPDLAAGFERAFDATPTWQETRHERYWRPEGAGPAVAEVDGLVHALDRERGGMYRPLRWTTLDRGVG